MLSSGVSTTHDRNRAWSVTPPGRYPDTGMLAAQDCTKSAPEPKGDPQSASKRGSGAVCVQTCLPSACRHQSSAQQIDLGASVHLAFDELQFSNLAFGLPI